MVRNINFLSHVEAREAEAMNEIEPFVKENLNLLIGDKRKWWASNFFDFMENDETYAKELKSLRNEARDLNNEDLVVLVGNEVTEEALPNYSSRANNLFPDPKGTSNNAWSIWNRSWVAEEKMHGRLLDRYLLLTGRVNMNAVDRSVDSLIENGMQNSPSLFQGILYPTFQEPATALSHMNMAKVAKKRGVKSLYNICNNISKDETRHATFYKRMSQKLMEIEPERTIISFYELMQNKVIMPAKNMIDQTNPEPPTLFEHFAGVANKIGVYTLHDYANIIESLNKSFNIAGASVKDLAAKAQDYLCELPNKTRKVAERRKMRVSDPVGFDWIYGRKA